MAHQKKFGNYGYWYLIVLLILMCTCTCTAPAAHGQGYRSDGVVQSRAGYPAAGATLTVCAEPAVITATGCTVPVILYTDSTLTVACAGVLSPPPALPSGVPCSNPLIADGLGNYHFYLPPGRYALVFSGSSLTTYAMRDQIFPCDPTKTCSGTPITGVVCDGATDITSAWNAFMATLTGSAHLVLPSGVCMFTTQLSIPDNVYISGQGKHATTLRQKSGTNSANALLCINGAQELNITLSDMTIDGNMGAQTNGGRGINNCASGNPSHVDIYNTIWTNVWGTAILLFDFGPTTLLNDISIHDNEFINNAVGRSVVDEENCNAGDISVFNPLRVKIVSNSSTGGGADFACAGGGATGSGDVLISNNVVKGALGFGAALGTINVGSVISGNVFDMPTSRENIIDTGDATFWSVVGNTIISGNACAVGCGGVGDGPPANHGTISGNTITGNSQGNNTCMVLGGSDIAITGNTCRGSGQAGIALITTPGVTVQGINVSGNTISNCGLAGTTHGGIELFSPATPGTFQNIDITGNRVFDDQGSKTCSYGVGIAINGSAINYNGFLIANNDLRDLLINGIFPGNTPRTNGLGLTGLSTIIRDNPGYDPASDNAVAVASQTANIGTTTLFTAPANSVDQYSVCVSETVIVPAGTTSTLPTVNISWTDRNSSGALALTVVPFAPGGNTTSTVAVGCISPIYPKPGTVVQYSTTAYASNPASAMQYALVIRPKAIN